MAHKNMVSSVFGARNLLEDSAMRKTAVVTLACLALGACATQRQTAGTAVGAVGGAIVGGPVGAVVGGAAGAVVTSPGAPLGGYHSHRCYYHDQYGNLHYHWCHY
jgi:uncharacterized protein YcfJ